MIDARMDAIGRSASALLLTAALCSGVGAQAPAPTRADVEAVDAKLARIEAAAEAARPPTTPPLHTAFTERELNAYLTLEGPEILPSGITMPRVQLGDAGRVRASAIVDLDAVRLEHERSVFDPLAYLTGAVEVVATGRVESSSGEGVIRYESATVGGFSVPQTVAQELLKFYTRTPERPRGFAFDEPFALPAGLRAFSVERGIVTITQ